MSAPTSSGAGRRRTSVTGGRLNPLVLLAVLIPVLTLLVTFGLRQPQVSVRTVEPESAPLSRADRGCPAGPRDRGQVLLASTRQDAGGEIELRAVGREDADPQSLAVSAGSVAVVEDGEAVLVTGRADLAPGLLAARVAAGRLAAVVCPPPSAEAWFTGLGARAEHASVIELQNPDVGAAVVDISFFSRQGPAEVPELLGVRVPGRSTYVVDLAATVPRRGDLAIRLAVTRGRLSATVLDRYARIGSGTQTSDWLAPQPEPSGEITLLGLPEGRGTRTLSLTNPGADQARVTLRLVTPDSTFAPADLKEVRVRPGSLVNVHLDKILAREVRRGAVGIRVEASQPVTAALTSLVDDDLVVAADAPGITGTAAVVLPPGSATVVLAGATTTGLATVTFVKADGTSLRDKSIEVVPGKAFTVTVPARAALVRLTLERTTANAVVLVEDNGAVVVPFLAPDEVGLVPAVRPADR